MPPDDLPFACQHYLHAHAAQLPPWAPDFAAAYAPTKNLAAAARAAGVSRQAVYKRSKDPVFYELRRLALGMEPREPVAEISEQTQASIELARTLFAERIGRLIGRRGRRRFSRIPPLRWSRKRTVLIKVSMPWPEKDDSTSDNLETQRRAKEVNKVNK